MRAVAFDLDGLMFNTEAIYTRVAERLLAARGHALDLSLLGRMMGRPARVALPMLIEHYQLPDTVETLASETELIFHELLPAELAPMPGLLDLLRALDQAAIPKAIATSSGRRYVTRVLELARLPTEFDFLLTAEDVRDGKPHPEIYLSAAQRFGIDPAQMVVLEDSENGCRAAVAAAATTVAVPGPHNAGSQYPGVALQAESLADLRIYQLLGLCATK